MCDSVKDFEDGYTNEVFRKGDKVRKEFSVFSASSIPHYMRYLFLRRELPTVRKRVEAEKFVRKNIEGVVNFPDVTDEGEDWVELDFIEGKDVNSLIESGNYDSQIIGEKVGEALEKLHGEDVFLMDWALDDILWSEGSIILIDFEFGGKSSSKLLKNFDKISIFSQAGNFQNQKYDEFLEGLKSETDISRKIELLGLSLSLLYNSIYFWDQGQPRKVLHKIIKL